MKKRFVLHEDTPQLALMRENKREAKVKEDLINLLKDDGEGNKHGTFAKVLTWYTFHIVPTSEDPDFTAATDYVHGIIYVAEGFLIYDDLNLGDELKKRYLRQLSILLRHEIAHNLMQHEIRMAKYFNDEGIDWKRMQFSGVIQSLANTLMDFEISNRRYTAEDKDLVTKLLLNGRIIHGLVTEEHRQSWASMTFEEMYKALQEEVNTQQYYAKQLIVNGAPKDTEQDMVAQDVLTAKNLYSSWNSAPYFKLPWDQLINSKTFKRFPEATQKILTDLYSEITNPDRFDQYTDDVLKNWYTEISKSGIWDKFDLVSPVTGELIAQLVTPEEKYCVQELFKHIKIFRTLYSEWYYRVILGLRGDGNTPGYSDTEIKAILDALQEPEESW